MLKYGIITSDYFKNNRLFDLSDKVSNRDDCLYHMFLLKKKLSEKGVELTTFDQYPSSEYDGIIFSDLNGVNKKRLKKFSKSNKPLYLIIQESELIRPENWVRENHRFFKKIFTWNDDWVDGKKYIKYSWPNRIPEKVDFNFSGKEKLCVMIAGNKMVYRDKRELYSERVAAIRWFEKNHPEEFDLYGIGWGNGIFKSKFNLFFKSKILEKTIRKIEHVYLLKKVIQPLKEFFPSYIGKVDSKKETYLKYKFAICYENATKIPGYITEKIFDCFFAGCVPIYLGSPNITTYIPENTFIDKRRFDTYDDLYQYIVNMTEEEYADYLAAIKNFLESEKMAQFSAERFAKTIVDNILHK